MSIIDAYINHVIAPSTASEIAEWDAIDARKMQEQIKKRPGRYESIKGFYVDSDCGPMARFDKNAEMLRHGEGMTIFTYEKRAQQALKLTQKSIKKNGHISNNTMKVCSTGEGNNLYHFLDDDSKIWLPTSDLVDICDEPPKSFWETFRQLEYTKYGWYTKGAFDFSQ